MEMVVRPGGVAGEVAVPSSKSETHRALLATALAGGGVVITPLDSRDTRATAAAIEALGGAVNWRPEAAAIEGFPDGRPSAAGGPIDCANSGTTLRLVAGIAALAEGTSRLTGDASIRQRPNGPLLDALADLGARTTSEAGDGTAPFSVTGPIEGGSTAMPGSVSSQFVSSVLLAGACAPAGVEVTLTSPLRSAPYLALTVELLRTFGVEVEAGDERFRVPGPQRFTAPAEGCRVGADPTAASYPLAAGVLAGDPGVTVSDVGERANEPAPILGVLEAFGVEPAVDGRSARVARTQPEPATVDLGDCIDLVPTAAVIAALADGTSHLVNCEHARYKESDRLQVTADMLGALGVTVTVTEDGLSVAGRPGGLAAGTIDPHGDHRIAMAGAVAALVADGPVTIEDGDCVEVSYPGFYTDLSALGARVDSTD